MVNVSAGVMTNATYGMRKAASFRRGSCHNCARLEAESRHNALTDSFYMTWRREEMGIAKERPKVANL